MIQLIIIAGGFGTRLWPMSRKLYPKQYLALAGELSMLQETLKRLEGLDATPPVIVCNEEQRFMVAEQMRRMGLEDVTIILEPEGRNTAPAIALAALHTVQADRDPLLLVLPADHLIDHQQAFHAGIQNAQILAEQDRLVTFGIVPDKPETGYGYIRKGENLGNTGFCVSGFVEKPDAARAETYLKSGDYLWNSGMFMFRAQKYIEALERFHRI